MLGLGYVGLVTAACFASRGYRVHCFDVDEQKLKELRESRTYLYETGLEPLVKEAVSQRLLVPCSSAKEAIRNSTITFVSVGTPQREDGSLDARYVEDASRQIGQALRDVSWWHLVVVRSTILPNMTEGVVKRAVEEESGKRCGNEFGLCMSPEFLSEGSAVNDMLHPDRIVIGEHDSRSGEALERLYRDFYGADMPPLLRTNMVNAELIKYASNIFLAMKVSFANMMAQICQRLGRADVEAVMKGVGLDKRVGPLFLRAGAGWGGSCFPKDLAALKAFARSFGAEVPLVDATVSINDQQPLEVVELGARLVDGLGGKRVALLGLAFKPNTDDMRSAVSIRVVDALLARGASVVAYDPKAMRNAEKVLDDRVTYAASIDDCLRQADLAILVTEWDEFKGLTPQKFKDLMRNPAVVDGRRIYDPSRFEAEGIRFAAIGLGPAKPRLDSSASSPTFSAA